jgi:hypothetical protein
MTWIMRGSLYRGPRDFWIAITEESDSVLRIVIAPIANGGALVRPTKKAHVGERFGTFPDVGLLFNEPPGSTGLFFS